MSEKFVLINDRKGTEKTFNTKEAAQERKDEMVGIGMDSQDLEIKPLSELDSDASDGATEAADGGQVATPQPVEDTTQEQPEPDAVEAEVVNSPEALSKDPIAWLESHNTDFVNTIKGKPAISKQGFRFIQSQFGITTESEVVETFDDPVGVIVWARAELPDGQAAEAHGEGYKSERDVDDNEFARYADTRAKNRAISDLTSAGALAVSEVQGSE